jgi:SAM-dependent methyltransferase
MGYPDSVMALLRSTKRMVRNAGEQLIWGGELRERVLLRLLGGYYESLFRRMWLMGNPPPHFENQSIEVFRFGFSARMVVPEYFFRGFFSAEVLRRQDRVLDIGCGDGFFTRRFLATRAGVVDAIDIDASAIARATRANAARNVTYLRLDAVNEPFPSPRYDAIVWDGALAHFSVPDSVALLSKIHAALPADGVFVGSESLGRDGEDHLQIFEHLGDITALFEPFWKHVQVRELTYTLSGGFVRREAYWRCSNDLDRLTSSSWIRKPSSAQRPSGRAEGIPSS